jgi:hypothetical protein
LVGGIVVVAVGVGAGWEVIGPIGWPSL